VVIMPSDPHGLARFVDAQSGTFAQVLAELQSGRKRSHWMWYVFPQFAGLGLSVTSEHFAIGSLDEARAYLAHPVLGPRLKACADAVLAVEGRTAHDIFGSPDDVKLRSSATLFAHVSPLGSVFHRIVDRYFGGEEDQRTLALIRPREA
jgi:uncharacterized protein (DUF1810 family)